jgi:DNA-binding CsgD family transcriptional regulator
MTEAADLSRLIGEIYDATLDPALWPGALRSVAHFAGGQAAGLLMKDPVSNMGHTHHQFGVEPHYLDLYRETYSRFDPLAPLFFCDIGEVSSRTDYLSDQEFFEGRFHHEWAKPQGWVDAANVVLDKSATSFAILSVMRDKECGMADDEMRRKVRLVAPHLRRASLIGGAIEHRSAQAATFGDTIDGLGAGVILVDAGGRIAHTNAAADDMLRAGDPVCAVAGRLSAGNPRSDHALRNLYAAACSEDDAVGLKGIAVPLTARSGERFVAHALPMRSGRRRTAGASLGAAAAVFIRKAGLSVPAMPEVVARSYGLTPAELRVLMAIVEVGGVPEAAEALGVGEATVKTHLHRLFAKTGRRRQADLVKLVAGFASPLVG